MLRTGEAPLSVSYHSAVSHQRSPFFSATGPCHRASADAAARESRCQSRTFLRPQDRRRSQKTLPVNSTKPNRRCLRAYAVRLCDSTMGLVRILQSQKETPGCFPGKMTILRLTAEWLIVVSRCKHNYLDARNAAFRGNWGDTGGSPSAGGAAWPFGRLPIYTSAFWGVIPSISGFFGFPMATSGNVRW